MDGAGDPRLLLEVFPMVRAEKIANRLTLIKKMSENEQTMSPGLRDACSSGEKYAHDKLTRSHL